MKVEFKGKYLVVTKEPGDPVFHDSGWGNAESRLLYHIKNKLIKQGYDVIKKPMWKDGHMVSETQQYIRSRNMKKGDSFMIWDDQYAVRNAAIDFNDGKVEYRVERDPDQNPKALGKKRPVRAITPVRISTGAKVPPFQPGLGDKLMKRFNPDQTGTIMSVLDHGTIVGLMVRKSDGSSFFINMDHRMFHHFAGDYDYRLIGMKVSYDGEQLYPVDTNPTAGRNPASRAKGHHCIDCGRYLKYGIPVDFYGQKAYKCVGCYYAGPVLSKMKPRLLNPNFTPEGEGLAHWVEDYKRARAYGNIKLARQIKKNIEKECKRHKLDPKKVFGEEAKRDRYLDNMKPRLTNPGKRLSLTQVKKSFGAEALAHVKKGHALKVKGAGYLDPRFLHRPGKSPTLQIFLVKEQSHIFPSKIVSSLPNIS